MPHGRKEDGDGCEVVGGPRGRCSRPPNGEGYWGGVPRLAGKEALGRDARPWVGKEAGEIHAWPPAGEEAGTGAAHRLIWIRHGREQICGVERERERERERQSGRGGCGPGFVRDLHGGAATSGRPELARSLAAPEHRSLARPLGKRNKVVGGGGF